LYATIAEKSSLPRSRGACSALAPAEVRDVEKQALTMLRESVCIVGTISKQTDINPFATAQGDVPTGQTRDSLHFVRIKRIRRIGCEPVYNMEVQDHHNFAVAGGLIVHNCIDATRYALEDDMRQARPGVIKTR